MRSLNRLVRAYFPPEATAEILVEIRPLMCPYDVTMGKAMAYAEMFLPSYDVQAIADQTYRLWFDEFMRFWHACHNSPPWESVRSQVLIGDSSHLMFKNCVFMAYCRA